MTVPSRVLMTADTLGGVWTYSISLSTGLRARGISVSLATMGAPLSPHQREEARAAGINVHESDYKLEWMNDPWRDVDAASGWLLSLERELRPDLIHLNNFAHANLPWRVPTLVVGHSCVFSWWRAIHNCTPPSEWTEYYDRVQKGIREASVLVGVSHAMLSELNSLYGPIEHGLVIYNGCPWEYLDPPPKEDFVLSTGRLWDAAKNIATLATAAESVNWPVYVAGEARHPEGGNQELSNVIPIGRLAADDLRSWYARAGIYALPALYEPFGLSVLEAALSGCALVLGDIRSLRELWEDTAFFVPPNDHEALSRAINLLASRPELRGEFGTRAQTRARIFTSERMVDAYLSAYSRAFERYARAGEATVSCAS